MFDKPVFKLEIVLCLLWARLLIDCLPFRLWRGTLGPIAQATDPAQIPPLSKLQLKKASDTGKIIRRIAVRMPFRANCLPQAMTGRWMLARRGIPARICIGACKDGGERELLFHAWLMAGERVVTGGDESERFQAFARRGD